ncbi:MAG: ComF family protein [Candidatus Omnitrophota bacterium]
MEQYLAGFKKNLISFVHMLLSPLCPTCGGEINFAESICSVCMKSIALIDPPMKTFLPHVKKVWSPVLYQGTICKCLRKLKYFGNRQMLPVFKEIIERSSLKDIVKNTNIDIIIPIPLFQKRHQNRGFNQSDIFSVLLSDLVSIPADLNCLEKIKHTRPQTGLNRQGRKINITKNVFTIRSSLKIRGKTILLVDDILTTGTTLDRCAEKLLDSGAKAIYGFTIAKTL